MRSPKIILAAWSATVLLAGCATKDAPTRAEIQEQSGTLATVNAAGAWKAGAATGPIADNWLASFDDAQLNTLVAEAMVKNPDLRVTAAKVERKRSRGHSVVSEGRAV